MTENNLQHKTYFVLEEFKKWSTRSCFVALTAMAIVLTLPMGVRDNLQDIWNSPERLTAIENDVDKINEMIRFIEDGDRAITLLDQ